MGRKRTLLNLSQAERTSAQRLLRSRSDPRTLERVRFALLGATGRHTLEELAVQVKRQRSTLQQWLGKFQAGGLAGLLERHTSPGVVSPVARAKVQRQLVAGLKAGRWTSAAHVAAWLQEAHGITRSRKSIYYWFEKFGLSPAAEVAPSRHPKSPGKPSAAIQRSTPAR
jgi:transposase